MMDIVVVVFYVFVLAPLAMYGWFCLHRDHVGPWIERHVANFLFRVLRRFL